MRSCSLSAEVWSTSSQGSQTPGSEIVRCWAPLITVEANCRTVEYQMAVFAILRIRLIISNILYGNNDTHHESRKYPSQGQVGCPLPETPGIEVCFLDITNSSGCQSLLDSRDKSLVFTPRVKCFYTCFTQLMMILINVDHDDWPEEQEKGHGGLDQGLVWSFSLLWENDVVILIIMVKWCSHSHYYGKMMWSFSLLW